jgi:hypothetical protein
MITRRHLLLAAPLLALGPNAFARPPIAGCCLRTPIAKAGLKASRDATTSRAADKLILSSGDDETDHYLGRALLRLAREFEIYPGCVFIDDSDGPNAYAGREDRLPDTHGTVYLGTNLFKRMTTRFKDKGMAIIAVSAHEFAHIYQFWSGYFDELTQAQKNVRLAELQADYLAGYFLALSQLDYPDEFHLRNAGLFFESLGDAEFNSPDHHGTPDQRVDAIEAGHEYGTTAVRGIAAAAQSGGKFVLNRYA